MPARNSERTIRRALSSTLRDLPADAEVIVLDDASTDSTAAIARGLDDSRVRVIRSDVNLGVNLAGERLLAEARGDLVARMDSDDVCLPGRFRASVRAVERGADLVFSTFQVIGAGLRKPVPPIGFSPQAARLALLLDCPYPHSTSLGRTEVLRAAGGYRAGSASEDYDLWLRAAAHGARMTRLARPTILLRVTPGSVSSTPGWREGLSTDADLENSYRDLVESVWGTRETPWFRHLAFGRPGALSPEGRALLEPFVERYVETISALPPGQRWYLTRRARQELGSRSV